MAWANAQQFKSAWIGEDCPDDDEKIELWLDKAERKIRLAVPSLQSRIDSGQEPDLAATVQDVVVAMVTRVFQNPKGLRSVTGTSGPLTETTTVAGDSPGTLEIKPDELVALTRGARGRRRASFINLIPPTSPFYVEGQ